jgi:hypothetical protein
MAHLTFERASIGLRLSVVILASYCRSFQLSPEPKATGIGSGRCGSLLRVAAARSRRPPPPPKCPNHWRVFASWNWLGGKSVANGIHHLAANRFARASQRIHRNPFCLQLCVLGPFRRLRPACRQKIAQLNPPVCRLGSRRLDSKGRSRPAS